MDQQRFDHLSRTIALGTDRRTVLRLVLGGAVALATRQGSASAAPPDRIPMCKPGPSGPKLTEVNSRQYERRLSQGYYDPLVCGGSLVCEPCCVEIYEPCSTDADCCSEHCRADGTCGGPCYCFDYVDPTDQNANGGPLCAASAGYTSDGSECLTNADCVELEPFNQCVIDPESGGHVCAYSLMACD